MSIKFTNQRFLATGNVAPVWGGLPTASMSFFFRYDGTTPITFGSSTITQQGGLAFAIGANPPRYSFFMSDNAGHSAGFANFSPNPGQTYHVAITWDSVTPSQKYWLNGVSTQFGGTQLAFPPGPGTGALQLGLPSPGAAGPIVLTYADFAVWKGYLLTAQEISDLRDRVKDPSQIGGSATFRGWYPLDGVSGAVPAAGDLAIKNAIPGMGVDFQTVTGTGSALYTDKLTCSFQSEFKSAYVATSGRQLFFLFDKTSDGSLSIPSSLQVAPTLKINGVDKGSLVVPWVSGIHYCLGLHTPAGVQINPGDVVTVSAPSSWMLTKEGLVAGFTDYVVANYSGKSAYGSETVARTLRPGLNISHIGPSEGALYTLQKNYMKRVDGPGQWQPSAATVTRDGKVTNIPSGGLATVNFLLPNSNLLDTLNLPLHAGLWAVGWDDFTPATPTAMALTTSNFQSTSVTLRADLGNPGTIDGSGHRVGIVRVYDVQVRSGPITLSAPLDAVSTTISVVTGSGLIAGVYILFDSEMVKVSSVSGTGVTSAVVVRAQFGTTAASHLSGTVGQITAAACSTPLTLQILVSGTTVPSYENAMIYGPGDFTPAAPTVLGPPDTYALSASFRERFKNGCGAFRWMDADGAGFGGNEGLSEPEYLRPVTDHAWGNGTYAVTRRANYLQARPYDPVVCPYVYSGVWGDPYTATLGADITTTPARGTVESITISDAASAPVLPGQYLVIGPEKFRVLDISGSIASVERGALGTTPVTHAAGPMTVNFRRATVSLQNFAGNNGLAFEFVTVAPHGFRTGEFAFATSSKSDLNVTYRLATTLNVAMAAATTVTLTNASVATLADTTWTVSSTTGLAGKWISVDIETLLVTSVLSPTTMTVQRGVFSTGVWAHSPGAVIRVAETISVASTAGMITKLTVHIDSEDMLLAQVVDATHITVTRSATSSAHASGANVTTTSDYVFLSDGGKSQLNGGAYQVFVTGLNSYAVLGGYSATPNQGITLAVAQDLDTSLVINNHYIAAGFPTEFRAYVVGQIPGANMWVNISHAMNDSCVESIARKIRDNLPPGRKVYVEHVNEAWNTAFQGYSYLLNVSRVAFGETAHAYELSYTIRSGQIHDVFKRVFDENGANRSGEVVRLFGTQQANSTHTSSILGFCQARGILVDAVCPANYTGLSGDAASIAVVDQSDDDQINDMYSADLFYRGAGGAFGYAKGHSDQIAIYNAATGRNAYLVAYEGGISHIIGGGAINQISRNRDCHYRPSFYFAELDFYNFAQTAGFKDTCMYNFAYPYDTDGSAGIALWGMYHGISQQPGYGDGRDGKFDNRLLCSEPGKANSKKPWVSLDANSVSVRGQAFIDWLATDTPQSPSGGIRLGGSRAPVSSQRKYPTGGLRLGGSKQSAKGNRLFPAGGLRLGGAVSIGTVIHGTGGLRLGGVSTPHPTWLQRPSGGLRLGGKATNVQGRLISPSGGIRFGGAHQLGGTNRVLATGGLALGGSKFAQAVYLPSRAGGLTFGAAARLNDATAVITPSGGLGFGAEASPVFDTSHSPSGGFECGGHSASAFHSFTKRKRLPFIRPKYGPPENR